MLKRFVEIKYDYSTWKMLLDKAEIQHEPYEIQKIYPDEEIYKIVTVASSMTGIPIYDLQQAFGEFLVPDLLLMYNRYINPAWKTFEMLEETERSMHQNARLESPNISPPVLNIERLSENEMDVFYSSERRMAGVAKYYHEEEIIKVTNLTAPDAIDVHLKVQRNSILPPLRNEAPSN
jgi:hypothetical protein